MLVGGLEIPAWVALTVVLVTLAYYYSTRNHGAFKKVGIPGPKPWPLVGTFLDVLGQNPMDYDMALMKKYGKFVGLYEGSTPVLLAFDGDWLKEVFIKNFSLTTTRREFNSSGIIEDGLFSLTGEHWKYVRSVLSPSFTQGKLKKMIPAINKCEDVFVSILKDYKGEPVEIRTRINALTMDVIATTAFGVQIDSQTDPNSAFFKHTMVMLDEFENVDGVMSKIRLMLVFSIMFLAPKTVAKFLEKIFGFSLLNATSMKYFENLCNAIITSRKGDSEGHDFVQSLADKVVEAPLNDPDTKIDAVGNPWSTKGLTQREVVANSFLFLFAGFQTTADSMLFAFYELAHHPEFQDKVYQEIVKVCNTEEVAMEQANQLHCVEWCINEAMRLYPQAFRFDRVAAEEFTVRGITVPKGVAITASGYGCHRDPDVWEDPEEFIPERFSPERMPSGPPSSYMPFGIGNRSCIGNRLAMLEMKLTLIHVLKQFKIEKCDQTPERPLKFKATLIAISPETLIHVKFTTRNN